MILSSENSWCSTRVGGGAHVGDRSISSPALVSICGERKPKAIDGHRHKQSEQAPKQAKGKGIEIAF